MQAQETWLHWDDFVGSLKILQKESQQVGTWVQDD